MIIKNYKYNNNNNYNNNITKYFGSRFWVASVRITSYKRIRMQRSGDRNAASAPLTPVVCRNNQIHHCRLSYQEYHL